MQSTVFNFSNLYDGYIPANKDDISEINSAINRGNKSREKSMVHPNDLTFITKIKIVDIKIPNGMENAPANSPIVPVSNRTILLI